MDNLRFLVSCVFVLCVNFCFSLPVNASPKSGLVLVHGTNDHRSDAAGHYWKSDFIDLMAQAAGGREKLLVVHCDFSHYMWDERVAGCLADQLLYFAETQTIEQLVLYTHSDGANVIRFILSNPTFDSRFMKIHSLVKEVIAIAPSSGGTPLADEVISGGVFEVGLGWILGFRNDAVKQQREGDMSRFNQEILLGSKGQLPLSTPFRVVVGTNVSVSPLNSASYCNGYFLNSALQVSKIYLEYCSDGFLNCSSQIEAGEVWFYDYQKTVSKNTLGHNQSRHNCAGLAAILTADFKQEGVTV